MASDGAMKKATELMPFGAEVGTRERKAIAALVDAEVEKAVAFTAAYCNGTHRRGAEDFGKVTTIQAVEAYRQQQERAR